VENIQRAILLQIAPIVTEKSMLELSRYMENTLQQPGNMWFIAELMVKNAGWGPKYFIMKTFKKWLEQRLAEENGEPEGVDPGMAKGFQKTLKTAIQGQVGRKGEGEGNPEKQVTAAAQKAAEKDPIAAAKILPQQPKLMKKKSKKK